MDDILQGYENEYNADKPVAGESQPAGEYSKLLP